jgi:uncharacterized damage-inducible protein DinB
MKPSKNAYGEFFGRYIDLVINDNLIDSLEASLEQIDSFWGTISEEKSTNRYTDGKWSIKELLQHIMDTERVFNYRALSVARSEKNSLMGYDHDEYALASKADSRSWKEILAEYKTVRQSTILLFKSFDDEQLDLVGKANGLPLSARAAGFITIGHEMHHLSIVQERYL